MCGMPSGKAPFSISRFVRPPDNTYESSLSIGLYLVIVFAFSWPFQMGFVFLGDRFRPIGALSHDHGRGYVGVLG